MIKIKNMPFDSIDLELRQYLGIYRYSVISMVNSELCSIQKTLHLLYLNLD